MVTYLMLSFAVGYQLKCCCAWLTPGLGCSSQSSTKQLTSGANGSRPAWKPT